MKKKFLVLLTIIVMVFGLPSIVSADIGPKPSIAFNIHNPKEQTYYVTLLFESDHYGPWQTATSEKEDDEIFNLFFNYAKNDEFNFVGEYQQFTDEATYSWNYYADDNVKLLIYYPTSKTFQITEVVKRNKFESIYDVDLSNDIPVVSEVTNFIANFIKFLTRVVITLIIEILIALIMQIKTKPAIKIIVIANLITQALLNIIIILLNDYLGALSVIFLLPIMEIVIFIIEGIIYSFTIKDTKRWMLWLYAFLANLASFLIGLFLVLT